MALVPLIEAEDELEFGGKAASLASALKFGLPVPPGFALSHGGVDDVLAETPEALAALEAVFSKMRPPVAARSSAVGEDSIVASFAGQHASVLNVASFPQLIDAIAEVVSSGQTHSAKAYREKMGMDATSQMAIVLQELLNPESAGVLFTRNPMTGADERVIEAAWGLGEVVVSGLVIPDYYRLARNGSVLERRIGDKDIALQVLPEGGTEEIAIGPEKAIACVLSEASLQKLLELATLCESIYGDGLDIEWCLAQGNLHLLQCRSITRLGS